MSTATPSTRLIALLGDPVSHSLSPRLQNAAIRTCGLDAVYLALRCDAADFDGLLRGIARAGGAGNVTVPHKERAVGLLDRPSDHVVRTGACNTFWLDDGQVCGDNTDVGGFLAALAALGVSPAGADVLVLGAGGAARAAVHALVDSGADRVRIANRTVHRARALQTAFQGTSARIDVLERFDDTLVSAVDLVVNATNLGLRPDDPLPIAPDRLQRASAVLDMAYRSEPTGLVTAARRLGIPAADGREMLLQQGALAFRRWWPLPPPVDAMRHALAGEVTAA